MRGSSELLTWLCRRIPLESASPIALPTMPTFLSACQSPIWHGPPTPCLIVANPPEFKPFSLSYAN
jgi:hypothetical protein